MTDKTLYPVYRAKLEIQAWLMLRTRLVDKIRYIGTPGWPVAFVGNMVNGFERRLASTADRTALLERTAQDMKLAPRDLHFAKLYYEALEPYERVASRDKM